MTSIRSILDVVDTDKFQNIVHIKNRVHFINRRPLSETGNGINYVGYLQAQNVDKTQHLGGQRELEDGEDVKVEEGNTVHRIASGWGQDRNDVLLPFANLHNNVGVDLGQSSEVNTQSGIDLGEDGQVQESVQVESDQEILEKAR